MDRSVWKPLVVAAATTLGVSGCGAGVDSAPPTRPALPPVEVRRPASSDPAPPPVVDSAKPEVSWETDRDRAYAQFLQANSGGMIRKAAVGIEKKGNLKIEISRAVSPEDTLPLTKSLMAGARKDFPDKMIHLSLYDPQGEPILKARYKPGVGVQYKIAHGPSDRNGSVNAPTETPAPASSSNASDPLARGGVTERDQKFAAWAEEHGKPMLRYVEADLEHHGRLWFGISHDVKPADVRPLTQSLLEGARKEFPRGELVATVFDPDGERIGRAHLEGSSDVRWEK